MDLHRFSRERTGAFAGKLPCFPSRGLVVAHGNQSIEPCARNKGSRGNQMGAGVDVMQKSASRRCHNPVGMWNRSTEDSSGWMTGDLDFLNSKSS
jgi:hypothetical protein